MMKYIKCFYYYIYPPIISILLLMSPKESDGVVMPTSEHCHSSVHTMVTLNSDWHCEKRPVGALKTSAEFTSSFKFTWKAGEKASHLWFCSISVTHEISYWLICFGVSFYSLLNKTIMSVLLFYSFFSIEFTWQKTELIYRILKYFFLTYPRLSMKTLPSYSQLPRYLLFSWNKWANKKPPVPSLPFKFLFKLGEANKDLLQKLEINYSQNGKSKIFLL